MRVVMFYHSLISCWNHGNAHFLRGVVSELQARGHAVTVHEPRAGWSITQLTAHEGPDALARLEAELFAGERVSQPYEEDQLRDEDRLARMLDRALDGAELVVVHEWTAPELIAALGRHRVRARYTLLFHDTHHRTVSAPQDIDALELDGYDGVLAFGSVIAEHYRERGWADRVWTWHEAADVRRFRPPESPESPDADLVWIGNWGDGERSEELGEFLLGPIQTLGRELGLRANLYGVRYPAEARRAVERAGAEYRGWLPNHRVPEVFARHRCTVHVPRRPYVRALPGIPTIRPFEAMACGIPLICSPWTDRDGLFEAGRDYLQAQDGAEMTRHLRAVLHDPALARELARSGRRRVLDHHTCAHRVDELFSIVDSLASAHPSTLGVVA